MADISSIKLPSGTTYEIKDSTAREDISGKQNALTVGNGINITSNVISNTQGIEYIVGTQTAATNAWKGVSKDSSLTTGKIIAYYLPYAGTSTAATLNLTMADGTTTGAIALRRQGGSTVTTHFAVNNVIILIYDGTYWKVSGYYYTDSNSVPTGYCTTAAATAAKSATCTYGYRDDATYFPCLFRYANTANNATLAISSYATTALPIYVNGTRTSSSNTFGAGVIMFLYYNSAYYCYNDGRFPIVVNGTVTSVQDELALYTKTASLATVATSGDYDDLTNKPTIPAEVTETTVSNWGFTKNTGTYSKPSNGIPKSDLASAVQTSLGKADTALQSFTETDPTVPDWAKEETKPTYTASEIGLGNVENKSSATIRSEITSSNVTTALGYTPLNSSLKGAVNGLAELDENGKVPSAQLPSYVDDVLEYNNQAAFPAMGESGKIYIAKDTNLTYRWSGSAYIEISASLALGETSSTAFAGDKGKTAYDHANAKGSAFSSGLYKITTNAQGHVTAATAVEKADITALGIPSQDTQYSLPVAGSSLGGVKSGTDITVDSSGNVSVNNNSHTHLWENITDAPDIPTESTVSGWGFTKNTGTYSKPSSGIPKTDLASAVQTSLGKADTALQSYTETDPIFTASAAHGITSTDITNWNNKSDFSGSYTDLTDKPTIPTATSDLTNDSGFTTNTGTVTSVRVQATSPVQSSTSTAQSATLNTTISLANGYGDTKNPYASKTKNYVLAAPSSANGTPSFRALVAADIPPLTKSKISDFPTLATVATSGNYSDLSGTPSLATVATSGDYDDLSNIPKLITEVSVSGGGETISVTKQYNDGSFTISETSISGYVNGGSYSNGTLKLQRKNTVPDITVFTADSSPTSGSKQLVTSGGVYTALASKANSSHTHTKSEITDFPTLATVATSGSYNDLTDTPSISGTLTFTDQTVASSAWISNSDLDYYGYRASIALSGVTASMMPQVTFTDSQLAEWDLAPICQSYAGGVYIYSAEAISEAITIPSIGLIGG